MCQQFTNTTLLIQGAKDFALEAAGPVTFWFTNSDGGFKIRDSLNVTVRGFSASDPIRVDRSPPPRTARPSPTNCGGCSPSCAT